MIYEVTMFAAKCDNCKKELYEGSEYSCMGDEIAVSMDMGNSEWHKTDDDKHYCCDCWSYDENDEVLINKDRFKP